MRNVLLGFVLALSLFAVGGVAKAQETITILADSPDVGNCYPFADTSAYDLGGWGPYMGFVYRNVPPFTLKAGDILAFDLGALNGEDVQVDIELAAATSNGGSDPALPYTKVVSNTQIPLNPNGDTIIGNYEMQFTVEAPFDFPGGGLIIRFSNAGGEYASYGDCDQVLVSASASDSSGYFVERFFYDEDGLPPYDERAGDSIGGFRVIISDVPPPTPPPPPVVEQIPTMSEWAMIAVAAGLGLLGAFYAISRKRLSA